MTYTWYETSRRRHFVDIYFMGSLLSLEHFFLLSVSFNFIDLSWKTLLPITSGRRLCLRFSLKFHLIIIMVILTCRLLFYWLHVNSFNFTGFSGVQSHMCSGNGDKVEILRFQRSIKSDIWLYFSTNLTKQWSNGLVVMAVDSQSRGPRFKTTG